MSNLSHLPKNWITVSLNDISIRITKGTTPTSLGYKFTSSGILFVKVESLFEKKINHALCAYIDIEADQALSRSQLKENDILFSIAGTLGRVAIVNKTDLPANTNQALALIRLVRPDCTPYIAEVLSSQLLEATIRKDGRGVGLKNLNLKQVSHFRIPLPPLNEQRRIVAKIEELTAHSKRAREALEDIPALIEQFKQSVLAAAFRGDLTADWREKNPKGQPNIEFFRHIHQKRTHQYKALCEESKKNGGKKPNKPYYLTNDLINELHAPVDIPKTWCQAPVGLICDCIVPGRDKPKSFTGTIPWITIPDLDADLIFVSKNGLGLTQEEILEVNAKLIPQNSVVMSCVGRFGISSIVQQPIIINQQLHAFLESPLIRPKFLMYHIKALVGYMDNVATSTTVSYLNKKNCNSLPINLPPIDEQDVIIQKLDYCFAKINYLQSTYLDFQTQVKQLNESLLSKAFRGELVPQDPNDEPADLLLDRIRAEREKLTPKKKTKRPRKKKSTQQLTLEGT